MRFSPATIGLILALATAPVLAGPWGHERREPPRPQQRPMPMQQRPPPGWQGRPPMMSNGQAAQRAQQINGGGRVLAVNPADNGYRVRVLKDGEVRSVYVPPEPAYGPPPQPYYGPPPR